MVFYKESVPLIEISTMVNCPMKCKLCPQKEFLTEYKGKHRISFEEFKTVVDKIPKDVIIAFSGMGEPWLNSECTKMVLYAYNTGHTHIQIFTTGLGLKPEDIDAIIHIPFEVFQLHIPDIGKVTEIPLSQPYLNMLAKLSSNRELIENFRVVTFGKDRIKEFVRLFPKTDTINVYNRAGALKDVSYNKKLREHISCGQYKKLNRFSMLPDGTVVLCCMDWRMKHKLGNLITDSYESLFESDEYKKVIKGLDDSSIDIACRECSWGLNAIESPIPVKITLRKEEEHKK